MPGSSPLQVATQGESPSLTRTRELAMSAAWHGGLLRSLHTTGGTKVTIVYRGSWSHGYGPDFAGAMLEIDGEPHTGAAREPLKFPAEPLGDVQDGGIDGDHPRTGIDTVPRRKFSAVNRSSPAGGTADFHCR